MKNISLYLLIAVVLLATSCGSKGRQNESVAEIAKEAYTYAFATVEHNKAVWAVLVNNETPVNRFVGDTQLFTWEDRVVVSPNNDTYYSHAVLDIRSEPVIISVPLIEKRYFCIQLCDMFTNCPDYVSTLATGDGPGNYMIAREDWRGEAPASVERVIKIPASVVLAIGRTQVFGADDVQAAEIAQSYKAVPLSEFTGTPPPAGEPLKWSYGLFDAKTGDAEGFFRMFNAMVQYQILDDSDKVLMEKFEAIGLAPGKGFSKSQFEEKTWADIEIGAAEAKSEILARVNSTDNHINYWKTSPDNSGRWGTDYMTRAAAAWKYIYVNTPEEAIYFTGDMDSRGELLNGANKYTITFAKEQIPQVKFFWSLTMYGADGFLIENPIGRYNIKDRDELLYGQDGSLTLYIQKTSPGEDLESNWLPAPDGNFYMILRTYGPSEDIIAGRTDIPGILKIEK